MNNNDYLIPGIAAIVVAIVAPIFWMYVLFSDYSEGIGMGLVIADWLFILIGAVIIYVYISLKQILHDQHNFHKIDALITMTIILSVAYYIAGFAMEVFAPMIDSPGDHSRHKMLIGFNSVFSIACTVIFGVLDVLIGYIMLRNSSELPELFKAFAVATLIQGIFELTIIFSIFSVFVYAVATLILAMNFLRKPEMIEVV